MVILKSGVLLKLVEEMKIFKDDGPTTLDKYHKPTLLQVRSIVPIMEEGDLWPNKGFHIKVCDSSHAMYVSLPQELDDMILGNNLKLGQFMYVNKLEPSHPVPILIGVTLLDDFQPCVGSPEDIDIRMLNSGKVENNMATKSLIDEDIEKIIKQNVTTNKSNGQTCIEKQCVIEMKDIPEAIDLQMPYPIPLEKESDSDSPKYNSSSRRRSWSGIPDSESLKFVVPKPRPSRSADVSPVRLCRVDSLDDNLSSTIKLRAKKTAKSIHNKSRDCTRRKICEPLICNKLARHDDQKLETKLSKVTKTWDNLPTDMVKLGKDVVKKRDASLFVATEALQEATIAEKLLKCLSKFADCHEEKKTSDHQPLIEKFLNLQSDLMNSKIILDSLTNISPIKPSQADHELSCSTVKKSISLNIERKTNAASWINAAIAFDIPPFPDFVMPIGSKDVGKRTKKFCKSNGNGNGIPKSKVASVKIQEKISEHIPPIDKENTNSWTKGSEMPIMACLVDSLLRECPKWFLPHLEKILDEHPRMSLIRKRDKEFSEMMLLIKRINHWLDMIMNEERKSALNSNNNIGTFSNEQNEQSFNRTDNDQDGRCNKTNYYDDDIFEDSTVEICERVKSKIYKVLLEQVHKNAMRI